MNRDFIFESEVPLITEIIKFFFASVIKGETFESVKRVCLKNPDLAKTHRQPFIERGQFSLKDFMYYWYVVIQPGGGLFKNVVVEEVLRRFCNCYLLVQSPMLVSAGLDYYQVNTPLAEFLLQRDALENLAFEMSHLVHKYADSVVNVVVTDSAGDEWNGTGFLLGLKTLVLTNKHVVDEDAKNKPRVFACGNEVGVERIDRSLTEDLALITLRDPIAGRPLFPYHQFDPLDEVVTMGYPRIPLSTRPVIVAHKGEINARISTSHGDRIVFSAKTAPGNSGGPLLNRAGLVVGIVTEDLKGGRAGERDVAPYFAAIPSPQIAEFFTSIVGTSMQTKPDGNQLESPGI